MTNEAVRGEGRTDPQPEDREGARRRVLDSMGRAFGTSFGAVEVDDDADTAADADGATAFTRGERIAFSSSRWAAGTRRGDFTVAHELAHVVQLRRGADPARAGALGLEGEADRAATAVLQGRSPDIAHRSKRTTTPSNSAAVPVLRQAHPSDPPATGRPALEPLVLTGTFADAAATVVTSIPRHASGVSTVFHVGRTLLVYRGTAFRHLFHLDSDAADISAGIYDTLGGRVEQLFRGRDGSIVYVQAKVPGDIPRFIDLVVSTERSALRVELSNQRVVHVRLGSTSTGTSDPNAPAGDAGQESGRTSPEGGEGGEAGPPLPAWAVDRHSGLRSRLRAEQTRVADLAQRTIGDSRPETLNRLYAMQGTPKRLALGRTGDRPAEQVTVDRTEVAQRRAVEASTAVPLLERDTTDQSWERLTSAARHLYLNRPARTDPATDPPAEPPMGVPGDGEHDPDEVPPNAPAYPSSIRDYGPIPGVVGVTHHFTMNLDWATDGQFAWAGPMASRGYWWQVYKIRDTAGTDVASNGRRLHRGDAAGAVLDRGFADLAEDNRSTTLGEAVLSAPLMGVEDIMRTAGTLFRSFFTLASQPMHEQVVTFDQPGTYVVVATSSQLPVHRTERNPNPYVRAPSVAILALDVADPVALARRTVAGYDSPTDRRDLSSHLSASLADREREILLIQRLIDLEASGTDHRTWTDYEARALRASLLLRGTGARELLRQTVAARDQLRLQRQSLAEVTGLKAETYRPQVAFVPDSDGRVLPVQMLLGEEEGSTDADQRWVIIDVSVPGHRDRYEGRSGRTGAAGKAAAINEALESFAGRTPYGRGRIAIRLQQTLLDQLDGETVRTDLRAHPNMAGRFWQRLESLATAAGIASLVVTGPAAAVLGVIGGVAGGAVAAHRMSERHEGGYLRLWDLQTLMDVVAVVGAAASIAGPVARVVPAGSRFTRTVGWVERGTEIYGYVQLGGSFVLVPVSLVQALSAIDPNLSPGQQIALQLEAMANAANSMVQLAVTASQMIRHAPGAERPLRRPDTEPAPAPRPQDPVPGGQEPVPQTPEPVPGARPPAPVDEPATSAGRPGARPRSVPEEPVDQSVVQEPIPHGTVIMAPEGQSLSSRSARDLFGSTWRSERGSEVALLRNATSGDYVVVIGRDRSVQLGEGNLQWREILPDRARTGRWVLEEHSHAADAATGFTPDRARWPSGADGDFLAVITEARTTGREARGTIRLHAPEGPAETSYSYDPGSRRPYAVDVALPPSHEHPQGRRYQRRYATIEDYHDDVARVTGESARPTVPDNFPGMRRGGDRTEAPQQAGPETPTSAADVPAPARAPGPPGPEPPAGPTPVPARALRRLTALEGEVRSAGESGDSTRVARANAELLRFQGELTAGLEHTGLAPGQIATLRDAGATVAQVDAVHAWLGERSSAAIRGAKTREARANLVAVAEALQPLLGDPTVDAALASMSRPVDAGHPYMNPSTIAGRLVLIPASHLPVYLRLVADAVIDPNSPSAGQARVLRNPEVLDLVDRFRAAVWDPLTRNQLGETVSTREGVLLERLASRAAADPEGAAALVDAVVSRRDIRSREAELAIDSPPRAPRRPPPGPEAVPATDAPGWSEALTAAGRYADTHEAWVSAATGRSGGPTRAELVTMFATIRQVEGRARLGVYAGFDRAQRVQLLGSLRELTRRAGLVGDYQGVANRTTGAVAEVLFTPEGARTQIYLPHPMAPGAKPSNTRGDYELPAAQRIIPDRRNIVELKSNQLSSAGASGVDSGDVSLSRAYVQDAIDDIPGLLNAPAVTRPGFEAPAGAVHLIDFINSPNGETRAAMLDVLLLSLNSPLEAARIGGGAWVTRAQWQASRPGVMMPAVPPRAQRAVGGR